MHTHTHTHTHSVDYNNSWLERLSHLCFPVELFLIYMSDSQSCPSLCDPMDCSLPGSFIHVILQARILEWVAISFRGSSQPRDQTYISCLAGGFFTAEPPGTPLGRLRAGLFTAVGPSLFISSVGIGSEEPFNFYIHGVMKLLKLPSTWFCDLFLFSPHLNHFI